MDQLEWEFKYPALMYRLDMQVLAKLVSQLPANSKIVEIGSRLGGSAKIILDHAPKSANLYCIDASWQLTTDSEVLHDKTKFWSSTLSYSDVMSSSDYIPVVIMVFPEILTYDSIYSYAKDLLSDYNNVTLIPAESPKDVQDWDKMVDFVFEDSDHSNPTLHDNIKFWWDKLNNDGIMAGHDYSDRFPDVIYEANLLADQEGCELHVEGETWWVVKKSKEI
jgi:hypothetical protein